MHSMILLNNIIKMANIALKKDKVIALSDGNHVLSTFYESLPSDRRYRCLNVKPRAHKAFIPVNQTFTFQLMMIIHVIMADTIVILYAAHYVSVYRLLKKLNSLDNLNILAFHQ